MANNELQVIDENNELTQAEIKERLEKLESKGIKTEQVQQCFNFVSELSKNFSNNLSTIAGVTNSLVELKHQQVKNNYELEKLKTKSIVELEKISQKYDLLRTVCYGIFTEREKVLNKDFELIDKGLKENNFELVTSGMKNLTEVVTKSPLSDINTFSKLLDSGETIEF